MGIRQKINENPGITTAVTAGIIAIAIGVIIWQGCGGSGSGGTIAVATKAFYTIDDGKTLFVEDINKIPPFPKDGKQAVKANVFSCDDGKTRFVGYLEMYTPQDKAMLEKAAAEGTEAGMTIHKALLKEELESGDEPDHRKRIPAVH